MSAPRAVLGKKSSAEKIKKKKLKLYMKVNTESKQKIFLQYWLHFIGFPLNLESNLNSFSRS